MHVKTVAPLDDILLSRATQEPIGKEPRSFNELKDQCALELMNARTGLPQECGDDQPDTDAVDEDDPEEELHEGCEREIQHEREEDARDKQRSCQQHEKSRIIASPLVLGA